MTDAPSAPWAPEVAVAQMSSLNAIWQKWSTAEGLSRAIAYYRDAHGLDVSPDEVAGLLGDSLTERKHSLENTNPQAGPDPRRKQSTAERVDDAIIQHLAATDSYAVAVELSAKLDAEAKRCAARKYLEVKAKVPEGQNRVTDTEANKAVDADDVVLEARLASDIAAAQAKASKARLDHWEHVIEWGRSVYSRESRADTR